MGSMEDKDYNESIAIAAPYTRAMIAVSASDERALSAQALHASMTRAGIKALRAKNMTDALTQAIPLLKEGDVLVVCGSLYLVQEIKQAVKKALLF
jgi:dihydrofolate synthase/folylpolyglutamate synthase